MESGRDEMWWLRILMAFQELVVEVLVFSWIGVGTKEASPLPPNRMGGFPAFGSPVGG